MTIDKRAREYWQHNETGTSVSFIKDGYVLGTADFLAMCGCAEACITHSQFNVGFPYDNEYDADNAALDLQRDWEHRIVERYIAERNGWLLEHEALTGIRGTRRYISEVGGPTQLHLLHKTVMLDIAAWYGYPAPADVVAAFSEAA